MDFKKISCVFSKYHLEAVVKNLDPKFLIHEHNCSFSILNQAWARGAVCRSGKCRSAGLRQKNRFAGRVASENTESRRAIYSKTMRKKFPAEFPARCGCVACAANFNFAAERGEAVAHRRPCLSEMSDGLETRGN